MSELRTILSVFVYIYGEELDYKRTLENATLASKVFDSVSEELQRFIAWLENVELRRAQPTDGAIHCLAGKR